MIAPLRRAHRGAFLVLAAGLPALVVFGLSSRRAPPVAESLPPTLSGERLALPEDVPDPLLYWTAGPVAPGDGLPVDARLVGSSGPIGFGAEPLRPAGGRLFVYSLATHEVVEVRGPGAEEAR